MNEHNDAAVSDALARAFDGPELDRLVHQHLVAGGIEKVADRRDNLDTMAHKVVLYARRRGQLEDLVAAAADIRPHVPELQKLSEVMNGDRSSRLSSELRRMLRDGLGTSRNVQQLLEGAYRIFAPESQLFPLDPGMVNPTAAIDILADIFDTRPLLHVVLYLIRMTTPSDTSRDLRSWIDIAYRASFFRNANIEEASRFVDAEIERYRHLRLHLLVAIEPPAKGEVEFQLTAWRQFVNVASGDAAPMFRLNGEWRSDKDGLMAGLQQFIRQVSAERRILGEQMRAGGSSVEVEHKMLIELFVPWSLHSEPADQWEIARDPQVLTLCLKHDFVLRSWNRTFEPGVAPELRDEWVYFWRLHEGGDRRARAFRRIEFDEYRNEVNRESISCSALAFTPHETDFRVVVMSGTPVAVWERGETHPTFLRFFAALLAPPIPPWVDEVSSERRARKTHSKHMTLLWDDADRTPAEAAFEVQLFDL